MKTKNIVRGTVLAAGAGIAAAVGVFLKDIVCRKSTKLLVNRHIPENSHWEKSIPMVKEAQKWLSQQAIEKVKLQAFDGIVLQGNFLPAKGETDRAVLCVHGYTGSGENDYALLTRFLHEQGYHVLFVDNRAHGESEGAYVGFGCLDKEDCYRWVHWLDGKLDGACYIFLKGLSMGAATVLMTSCLNLPPRVKGIVSDCGFTSPMEQFCHVAKVRKMSFGALILNISSRICKVMAGYGFTDDSTIEAVKKTKIPVFLIHGEKDDYVPLSMAKEIYEACVSKKQLWIVPEAQHAESYYLAKEKYEKYLIQFFDRCLVS